MLPLNCELRPSACSRTGIAELHARAAALTSACYSGRCLQFLHFLNLKIGAMALVPETLNLNVAGAWVDHASSLDCALPSVLY